MFTYAYSQPEEYHFSLDSIEFAEFVVTQIKDSNQLKTLRMLDLCAGCGVIGFQIAWFLRQIKYIDFLEVQETYTPYFKENLHIVNRPELECHWHRLNYEVLMQNQWQNQYDLIVSNPPYFQAGHGMLSPSKFKNHCRFFLDSTFDHFILAIANTLREGGKAYFLLRPLMQHGIDLITTIHTILQDKMINIHKVASIRGNDVVCLEKIDVL